MSYKILAINPGSTSTKIAVYNDDEPTFTQTIVHTPEELAQFPSVLDQFQWRKELIEKELAGKGIDIKTLSVVIGRGGIIAPVESGVYDVNEAMIHDLYNARLQHASNLGGLLAHEITGSPELARESIFHALNQKAVARLFAKESGKKYEELNLVVCHMGGGCTVSAHRRGRVIDTTNALDGCGPMSPERSGSLPPGPLIRLCFSGKYTEEELIKKVHGKGGLVGHLGTTSVPEVLDRIMEHDLHAMLIMRAMCYSIAKEIGAMAVALKGEVDAILLTGGIAHSKRVTDFIADHVDFIAPIFVYPGENELKALAMNALAVLRGEREAKTYVNEEYDDPSKVNETGRKSKLREWLIEAISPEKREQTVSAIRHYLKKWYAKKN